MIGALLLASLAHAERVRFGLTGGVEGVTNDPFLNRTGWRHGVNLAVAPWAEVGATFTYYPVLGHGGEDDPDWKPLSKQLLLNNSVSPDISKMTAQAQLVVRVHVVRAPIGGAWIGGLGLVAGPALFATSDDLVALQNDGPEAVATQNQVHAGAVGGLFFDVRNEWFGIRAHYEHDSYIETVNSSTLEMKNNALFGLEALCWF